MVMAMVVGMAMLMQMLVVMGMGMIVLVLMRVGMGMGYTVVGVLMGMIVGMLMGVVTATHVIVMDMHSLTSLDFGFIIFSQGVIVKSYNASLIAPMV